RPVLPALHLIVVGALGTLSGSVMLRLAWQRARRTFPPAWQVTAIAILVAAATISRYLAGATPYSQPELLWFSSGCWALTFAGVAGQVMALYPLAQKPGTVRHSHRK
ncbi:NnrS family protein, partial [Marinobacter nauticus]|uniref:NnrS family protein n=1 Tax=Marinobacter nauticus TaxID=2743 RepID=UPI00242B1281